MLVHDLKGPLAAIIANLDLLLFEQGSVAPDAVDLVEASRTSCNTLMHMVLNLLDLARSGDTPGSAASGLGRGLGGGLGGALQSGGRTLTRALPSAMRPADPAAFLRAQADMLRAIGRPRQIAVDIEISEETPGSVVLDEALLARVLLNLTMNAVEHAPEGGHVGIRLGPNPARPAKSIEIRVSDDGAGVPPLRDRIFDAYFTGGAQQTSRVRGNHGLGLAFCRLACRAQDGAIELLATDPPGATFRVTIPRA